MLEIAHALEVLRVFVPQIRTEELQDAAPGLEISAKEVHQGEEVVGGTRLFGVANF